MMKTPLRFRSPFSLFRSMLLLPIAGSTCLVACSAAEPAEPGGSIDGKRSAAHGSTDGTSAEARSGTASATHLDESNGEAGLSLPFTCGPSKSPMFASQEVLDMRISADFTKLNTVPSESESSSTATITVAGDDGAPLTATIVARGNSRFRNCAARPFALKFDSKQKGNVFEGLGKSVKFVSHCGYKEGAPSFYQADSPEEYEQRVVMEHTIYQVLDPLDVPSLKTRLVRLTYHDTQANREEVHFAFVREPEDTMAKRCGAVESVDATDKQLPRNENATLLLHLLNGFVLQSDWSLPSDRNVIPLTDPARTQLFHAPYDFDLVGVFRPDYERNNGRDLSTNASLYRDWLRLNQSPTLFREIELMLQPDADRPARMRARVEQVPLNDRNRAVFAQWIETYLQTLDAFRSCEGKAGDPSQQACYVHDDYGDTLETATPMDLGVGSYRLEPPADVDVLSVQLEAGQLYTFGASTGAELLDPTGVLISQSGEDGAPRSTRPSRGGTAYVRLSLGGRLVSSNLYAQPEQADRVVFLYADDYEASLAGAPTLEVGQPLQGNWEVSRGTWDEDWFRVRAATQPTVHIVMVNDAMGSGRVDVWRNEPDAFPLDTVLLPGDNDVSWLFEGPGDYVVNVTGYDSTYTIELR